MSRSLSAVPWLWPGTVRAATFAHTVRIPQLRVSRVDLPHALAPMLLLLAHNQRLVMAAIPLHHLLPKDRLARGFTLCALVKEGVKPLAKAVMVVANNRLGRLNRIDKIGLRVEEDARVAFNLCIEVSDGTADVVARTAVEQSSNEFDKAGRVIVAAARKGLTHLRRRHWQQRDLIQYTRKALTRLAQHGKGWRARRAIAHVALASANVIVDHNSHACPAGAIAIKDVNAFGTATVARHWTRRIHEML